MSVWKKASKAHQKTHKERHQPEARQHLGLLEKKKDYQKRARDNNEKKETLKLLRKRALNKNPDEFYHHMLNSKLEDGQHFEKETRDEDTPDQVKLMRTQDYKYIVHKRNQERRKIEKLQAELHMTSVVDPRSRNKRIVFKENLEETDADNYRTKLSARELPEVDLESLDAAVQLKKQAYKELARRIKREKELAIIQEKLEVQRQLANKSLIPPKRIKRGTANQAPVYLWKYERKK